MSFKTNIQYTADTIDKLSSVLHDVFFDLSEVKHDEISFVLSIPYRTTVHNGQDKLLHHGLLVSQYERDWLHRILFVHNVTSYEAIKDQGINTYSFYGCKYDKSILTIKANEELTLKCAVESIEIEDKEVGFKGKARFKVGPMNIRMDSGKIFE